MNPLPSERLRSRRIVGTASLARRVAAIAVIAASVAATVSRSPASAADLAGSASVDVVVAQAATGGASAPPTAATTLRAISIRDGKAAVENQTIVVAQGAQVELQWRSDRPIALHLHGYDIETKVTPPAAAVMAFTARLAGRFPVTEHRQDGRHHRAVAYLEVRP